MKRSILFFFLFAFMAIQLEAQAILKFDKTSQHLGFVRQGDTLHFQYVFTNTGNQPLIISDTKVECACTVVDKPDNPILPGKQDVIKVSFRTNDAIDIQNRTVTVFSNASNSPVVVRFKCVVLKAKKP
jgi:hypothetical protein